MSEPQARAARILGGESFSFADAIGGWRGLIETALPGIVYVVVVTITKTWMAPTIAALAVVALLVIVRLIQRAPITQALAGVVGVLIGAVWAWRTGNATGFYGWGLVTNAAYLVGLLISMAVRWPIAGVVMLIAGPVPESAFAMELWCRCAYWKRSSFSLLAPSDDTSCAAVESIASRKSVARSSVLVPPPLLYGASFLNCTQRRLARCALLML